MQANTSQAVAIVAAEVKVPNQRWQTVRWRPETLVAEASSPSAIIYERIQQAPGLTRWRWRGLSVRLYKDACHGYWMNLTGATPCIYVVVRDDDGWPSPILVTFDEGEAGSYGEGGDEIWTLPLPENLHAWVEAYLIEHFEPQHYQKRKRRNWFKESEKNHGK